jgi:hypothetical protein
MAIQEQVNLKSPELYAMIVLTKKSNSVHTANKKSLGGGVRYLVVIAINVVNDAESRYIGQRFGRRIKSNWPNSLFDK